MSNDPLDNAAYNATIIDLTKQYDMLKEEPLLGNTWIGNEARARLNTLDSTVNPQGPNVPLIRSIEDLLDK